MAGLTLEPRLAIRHLAGAFGPPQGGRSSLSGWESTHADADGVGTEIQRRGGGMDTWGRTANATHPSHRCLCGKPPRA